MTVSWCSRALASTVSSSSIRAARSTAPGLPDLQGEGGVQQVAAGHALVHEAAGRPDVLGHVGQEGDDVVLDGVFDLQDPGGVEVPLGADLARRPRRGSRPGRPAPRRPRSRLPARCGSGSRRTRWRSFRGWRSGRSWRSFLVARPCSRQWATGAGRLQPNRPCPAAVKRLEHGPGRFRTSEPE